MRSLAITRREPGTTARQIEALQVPEAKEVWRLMGEDFIREIHFDPIRPAVVLTPEAESAAAARARLATLPAPMPASSSSRGEAMAPAVPWRDGSGVSMTLSLVIVMYITTNDEGASQARSVLRSPAASRPRSRGCVACSPPPSPVWSGGRAD